ncbi:MAG: hypothetical protein GY805_38955 [Chloroflexi bacterium]|nr:hypothetical protein [Chloroflexota bacterium]
MSRNEIGGILFMSVFVLIGLLFIVSFLFSLKGKVWVLANRARIKATWNLFGLEYNREGKTTDIVKVDIVTRYGENLRNQETLEVGVEFQDGGRIKFGAFLSKEERKWIVGELRAIIWQANRATDKL